MKKLSDMIEEVLVHKHATKDTKKDDDLYVDLGLPSGTLWATKNLEAASIYDPGAYYRWNETTQVGIKNKGKFSLNIKQQQIKYSVKDNSKSYNMINDPVELLLGKEWCTPSDSQFNELRVNTKVKFDAENNVAIYTSEINGKELIIPIGGFVSNTVGRLSKDTEMLRLWTKQALTSSKDKDSAYCYKFNSNRTLNTITNDYKKNGYNIRPIKKQVK